MKRDSHLKQIFMRNQIDLICYFPIDEEERTAAIIKGVKK